METYQNKGIRIVPLFWCVFLCFLEVKIMFDVAIIGAGVIGSLIARRLSAYDIRICVLEKENDVAMGSTRANSAIVHAGFDAKEKSLKARFNVLGSEMMEQTAKELGVKYSRNGSLVIGGDVASVEAAVKDVLNVLENLLHFSPTQITRT